MVRGIIFDFNRTLYNPETSSLTSGTLDLLRYLKNSSYKLCLISKKTQEERREQISELGLDLYFPDILVIEGEKTKQDFEMCAKAMSLAYSEIAVVGDRVRSEITLGNEIGMTTFWYRSGKFASETPRNKEEEPDFIIDRLEELVDYLI